MILMSAPQRILDSSERILGRAEGALQWPAKGTARDRPERQGRGLRSAGALLGVTEAGPWGQQGAGVTHTAAPLKLVRAQCCHSVESVPDSRILILMPGKWHAGTLNFLDVSPLSLLLWLLHEAASSFVLLFPFLIFSLCFAARPEWQ